MTAAIFRADPEETIPRRLVKYLLWANVKTPNRAIDPRLIAQSVLFLARKPTKDSKDVKRLLKNVAKAREIMRTEHKLDILNIQGSGLRCSVDSGDVLVHSYEADAKRQVRHIKRMDQTRSLINPSELKDPALRSRFNSLSAATRVLTSGEVLARLALPPVPAPANGKK